MTPSRCRNLRKDQRAIADGKVRRDLEPTLLDVDEEFTPALCALAQITALGQDLESVIQTAIQLRPTHVQVSERRVLGRSLENRLYPVRP
jgi:hypothetical protein